MTTRGHVRAYRALVTMYPRRFRNEYGDDMVLLFEDMLRDRPATQVWWLTARDAASSIPIQVLEVVMSARAAGFLSAALFAFGVVTAVIGGSSVLAFALPSLVALTGSAAAFLYWRSNRAYVEPGDRMHRYWLRVLASGALILGGLAAGSTFSDADVRWEILVGLFLVGWGLVGLGAVLTVWHVAVRLRVRPATP